MLVVVTQESGFGRVFIACFTPDDWPWSRSRYTHDMARACPRIVSFIDLEDVCRDTV